MTRKRGFVGSEVLAWLVPRIRTLGGFLLYLYTPPDEDLLLEDIIQPRPRLIIWRLKQYE